MYSIETLFKLPTPQLMHLIVSHSVGSYMLGRLLVAGEFSKNKKTCDTFILLPVLSRTKEKQPNFEI